MIFDQKSNPIGFIKCTYEDSDICTSNKNKVHIFIHDLHICKNMRCQGYGHSVIEHLLKKGVELKMLVVNENLPMQKMLNKFKDVILPFGVAITIKIDEISKEGSRYSILSTPCYYDR